MKLHSRGVIIVVPLLLMASAPWVRAEDAKSTAPAPAAISVAAVDHPSDVDFEKEILPILNRSCLACHNKTKSKAKLVLETPENIRKGGSSGPAVVPGHGVDSLLLLAASHAKDDLVMPPADNKVAAPDLTPQQLGLLRLWIDQGAQGEVHDTASIQWQALPHGLDPVYAVAVTADGQFAACGRANQVFLYNLPMHRFLTSLTDPSLSKDATYAGSRVAHRDVVNAAAFSPDGRLLATAGYREVKLWRHATDVRRFTVADALPARILCLAATPDGSCFAAGDAEGHIRLFDSAGRRIGEYLGLKAAVNGLCFAPDGTKLASGSADGSVRVWSAMDGRQLGAAHCNSPVNAVAWADSSRLVGGADDELVRVWRFGADPENPLEPQGEIAGHDGAITSLAPVPSQPSQILSGSADGTARLWDLNGGKELRRLTHGGPIGAVAVRPDGKRLATAGSNGVARLWDPADGKLLAEMRGDREAQQNVLARQRDLATAISLATFHASALQAAEARHTSELARLKQAGEAAVTADKTLAEKQKAFSEATHAKAAADKVVSDLNAELKRATEARDAAEKASKEAIAAAKAALDGKSSIDVKLLEGISSKAYAAGESSAALQALADRVRQPLKEAAEKATAAAKIVNELQPGIAAAQAAQVKAQGELEASARLVQQAADEVARAKDRARVAETRRAKADEELVLAKKTAADAERPLRALAFATDNLSLAFAGDDAAVHTYSAEDGAAFETFHGHRGPVLAVTFSGANFLLSAGTDRSVAGWEPDGTWALERVLGTGDASSPLADRVNALAFSPDGQRLATGGGVPSRSGEIKLWQVASGKLLQSFDDVHSDSVLSLAFAPGGDLLASAAADRFMKVIDASSGKLVRAFEGHTNHVLGVCWKRDGHTLATAGGDNVIKTWDLFTGQRLKTIEGFAKEVTSVNYLADTNQLLVTCGDGTVRIVADDGAAIRGVFAGSDFMNCSAVTPDGKTILAGGDDGLARRWSAPGFQEQTLPPR